MSRTAEDFLADIAANPDDDALKGVFADWLLERGDPRGELMALQLKEHRSDEDLSREALLVRTHYKQWLPDEVLINLVPSSIVFERGVFAGARVSVRSGSALLASLSHPVWSTVRALSGAPLELLERCPVLQEAIDLEEGVVTGLALKAQRPGRLKTLGVIGHSTEVLARAFASPAFELVRELRLGFGTVDETRQTVREFEPERMRWLFHSPLGQRIRRLVLHTGWLDLTRWLMELERVDPWRIEQLQLTPMVFEASNWWLRFTSGRRHVRVFPGSELNASFSEGPVREIFATAPRGWFEQLTLPDDVGWGSVRRLPCFERAVMGTWSG